MKPSPNFKYLPVVALALAASLTYANQKPVSNPKRATQAWVRTGTPSQPNQDNTWEIGSMSETCNAAEKLCKGIFEDSYNPNSHTDAENVANNQSGSTQTGYVPE